jgi:hypothetical protein
VVSFRHPGRVVPSSIDDFTGGKDEKDLRE